MPAKTPIYLKTPTDKRGRKLKLRDVLSGDMISPPLGDVRHSAHVGVQGLGDMFGDVAFLQGNMDMLPPPNVPQDPQPLWTSTSLPLLLAQEEAPPKPPRLHLDTPPQHGATPFTHLDTPLQHGLACWTHLDTPPQHGPAPCTHLDTHPQHEPAPFTHLDTPPQHGPASWTHSQEISLSSSIQPLVPSSNSSSEDSLLDTCGPLEVPRGLSLDFDAGLSNEDLRSADSPLPLSLSPALPRSESIMAALDLDLGPSIMDDVLRIMDRYRGPSPASGP